jgi:hypothetical protein
MPVIDPLTTRSDPGTKEAEMEVILEYCAL